MLKVAILMMIVVIVIAGIAIEKQLKQKQFKNMSETDRLKKDVMDIKRE